VPKTIRFIPALGAVFFAVMGLSACGGVPSNAVVQVGSTPITKDAFEHWMGVAAQSSAGQGAKPAVPVPPNYTKCIANHEAIARKFKGKSTQTRAQMKALCEQEYNSLKQEVLGFLISSQWVLNEAKALDVNVTDAEVKKQFEKIRNAQFPKAAEFQKFLQSSGQTVSDLLLRVKLNMLSTKIQQKISKKHAVTEQEVTKYYEQNKSRYGTAEKRTVAEVLTKTEEAAKKAKQEIESGKSFASVAKAVSIDPTTRAHGGLIVGLTKGTQSKALDEAIFSAPKGKLEGPVKTPFGYVIFEVKSITAGTQQPLAKVKATIKSTLQASQQQEALSKFVKQFKSKWTANTECRAGYVVADCKEYKAPKTTTTGAPKTTTTTTAPTKTG
jgi:parvulin-like peptidyl-prolyl isomerase